MTLPTFVVEPARNAVAAAFIASAGKVLVAQRAFNKKIAGGLWHLPGGHVETGETPQQALVREIEEEFQVAILVGELIHEFAYVEHGVPTAGFVFMATLVNAETSALRFDPADTAAIVWATPAEAAALFPDHTDHNYEAVLKAFAQLGVKP